MANTVIQLKYSTVTATPSALNIAEPAYSYSSNTFFIGSPDGTGSIAIGGKFYLDQQQDIYNTANAAFDAANNAVDTWVRDAANSASSYANSAFGEANTANITAEAAFAQANTNATDITVLQGVNATQNTDITTANNTAEAAFAWANAAYDYANTSITTSGGTITGSLNVTSNVWIGGNLIVAGTQTVVDSTIVQVADNIITLNAAVDQASAPTLNSGIEIDRGSSDNVSILWNETSDKWTFTNDGTNYLTIADAAVNDTQNTSISNLEGVNTTQNTSISNLEGVNTTQNTSISNLEGVNTTQNTSITAAQVHADGAFNHANSAHSLANGTAGIANTDFTNISITAGDFGGADIVPTFHVTANGRIDSVGNVSIALAASQITSGTLGVARGGTGAGTFTTNGVLLGQGTSALTTASSSTEGHVLTINDSGVPTFAYLSGGTF